MNTDELAQYLEAQRKELSENEFFSLLFELLDKQIVEERDVLEPWLMTYAWLDPDHVAKYWESFLRDEDKFRIEVAVLRLSILAGMKKRSTHAYNLLQEFLGQEPVADKIDNITRNRLLNLFPHSKKEN